MADKEKASPKTDAMRAIREARWEESHRAPAKKVKKRAAKSDPAKPASTDKP